MTRGWDSFKVNRDPWWKERTDASKEQSVWNQGFDEGYSKGVENTREYNSTVEQYEERIEQLESLLSANVRVMKKEIEKEMKENSK